MTKRKVRPKREPLPPAHRTVMSWPSARKLAVVAAKALAAYRRCTTDGKVTPCTEHGDSRHKVYRCMLKGETNTYPMYIHLNRVQGGWEPSGAGRDPMMGNNYFQVDRNNADGFYVTN